MMCQRLWLVLGLVVACQAIAADPIVVTKPKLNSNPKLKLVAFTGTAAAKEALLRTLKYSDWFDLTEDAAADYQLAANHAAKGPGGAIELVVTAAAGGEALRLQAEDQAPDPTPLMLGAVDTLIQKLFKNPGFCRTRLAYVKEDNGTKEIWLTDFAGGAATQLTTNKGLSVEPDWDGRTQLVYTLYDRFSTSVILVDLAANRHRRLSNYPGLNSGAALSSDGKKVVLCLSKDDTVDLYALDVASNALTRLTESRAPEASPCWSPDNRSVCFVSDCLSGKPTLCLTTAAGGGKVEKVLPLPDEAVSPDWSPVSNRLCFALRRGAGYTIGVVNMADPARAIETPVTADGSWESPSWAADGRHVACTRNAGGKQGLYLVDTWYGKMVPLPETDHVSLPSYSP